LFKTIKEITNEHSESLSDITDTVADFFQAIWPYSGHYLPTEENFREFIRYLEENSVDLTNVKVNVRRFYSLFL
jgi:hypothetical protein